MIIIFINDIIIFFIPVTQNIIMTKTWEIKIESFSLGL